jgi:salicylate biosynthesis isochorismate synthase
VLDFVASSLSLLSRPFAEGEIVAIAGPAPVVSPSRLLVEGARLSPISHWNGRDENEGSSVALVGFGEAARIDGHGPERLAQVTHAARRLFASLREQREDGASNAPGPRLLGGLSFRTEPRRSAPWSSFADASFSLPRWLYMSNGAAAWLWFCARAEGLGAEREAIAAELVLIEAALAGAQTSVARADVVFGDADAPRIDGMSRDAFRALVEDALARIRARELEKVVPVAASRVTTSRVLDARLALARLSDAYPTTTRFAVERGGRVFLGASPERLVSRRGRAFATDALAGTARRGVEDEAILLRALLASPKERREHALVVEAIAAVLGPRASSLEVPVEPRIRSLRNVHHLWTPIRGVLRDETHVLSLVEALHPTPAVAGAPRDRATAWIAAHEPEPRGWYTGAVGWIDAAGDGDFAVAIRAGLVGAGEAWLYAGAGIVEGSDPSAEYAETRAKQAPMLAALGIAP